MSGDWSQCGGPIGGWKFGNTINGAQAEYLLVPSAQANLAKIPDDLTDEFVVSREKDAVTAHKNEAN